MKIRASAAMALYTATGCMAVPLDELTTPMLSLEAPEVFDFGSVPLDEPFTRRFQVRNASDVALTIEAVRTTMLTEADFELSPRAVPATLAPGATGAIEVTITTRARTLPDADLAELRFAVDGLPENDPRLPVVRVWARVSPSGLVAEPNPLTIGPVPYLQTSTGTVGLRNLTSRPLDVFARRVSEGRAAYDEAVTRGIFGNLPPVDGTTRLARLDPGEVFVVPIEYTAPDGPGEAKEQATWRVTTCAGRGECELQLVVQGIPDDEGPIAEVSPTRVFFNQIPVLQTVEQQVRIGNPGGRTLELRNVRYEGSRDFTVELADADIEPEGFITWTVRYRPSGVGLDNGQISFTSNDPRQPRFAMRVAGAGVRLPPCDITVSPSVVDYGRVEVFGRELREVVVRNLGTEDCLVFDPQIENDVGTDQGAFQFVEPPPVSITINPGRSWSTQIRFTPTRPGLQTAKLILRTASEPIEVVLRGDTPAGVAVACTQARVVEPGTPSNLTVSVNGGNARRYQWRVREGPTGGVGPAFAFAPDTTSRTVSFTPNLLGVYVVEAEVETNMGEVLTCPVEVTSRSSGLKVTMTWDGAGDLDLHLHRGARAPWFGPQDCHFDNMTPLWDPNVVAANGANPSLDRDDTSGDGPENIRIQSPEIGVTYTVGVSHFERARGRSATVAVFCGRAAPVLMEVSRPFGGTDSGGCSRNDFWTVASLVFTAQDQCSVQSIDTYRLARDACRSY